jgi:outer membrane protein assembly factor BamE (lipoprotein component of BamABCDE complex)
MVEFQLVKYFLRVALPCIILATAGCMSKVDVGGYVDDVDIGSHVIIGESTRDDVVEQLGSPSARSSFGDEAWYYISDRMETVAFFKPEVVDQKVTRISFNEYGYVSSIEQLDRKNAMNFRSVSRETPTEGHSMTIMEQLVGNVGRFNGPPSARRAGSIPGSPGGM